MPRFSKGLGLASIAAKGIETYTDRDRIQAEAAEFKRRKSVADAQNNPDVIQTQIDAVTAQNKMLIGKQAKTETFDALRMYTKTGKVASLNQALQSNPTIRKAWRGITSIDTIDPEQDQAILNKARVKEFNPFVHLKGTMPDGQTQVINMQNMMLGTGFLSSSSGLSQEEIDTMIREKNLFGSNENVRPGPAERDAAYFASQGVTTPGGEEGEAAIAQSLLTEKLVGNQAGQLEAGNQARESLNAAFGGEEGYFAADMSILKNRTKVANHIAALQKLQGLKINASNSADIKDLRTLTTVGGIAAEKLTPEVTGKFDTVIRKVQNYISNSVDQIDQVQAQSAHGIFRNTLRHALFGSALTPTEVSSFNEAFGTIGQKYPAVVTQFKLALQQTKSKIESIFDLNDPHLAHYYFGKSADKLDTIIRSLDERIEMITQAQDKENALIDSEPDLQQLKQGTTRNESSVEERLDALFGPVSTPETQ